ncbi:hypothetical protein [Lentzea flava]|uniref:Uncharacterized protein n=1 Tax=Lentzea flava TaxID=103732 RepID=A0ABQ2UAF2_9PSEU|nr:hypothetical protein [Lentzea flava]MCP2197141.1 hypothetical protein [Lentzea flava]GGU13067.1 hypothetical protein GCM10010178_00250 [Lentzea flava]
MKPALIGAVCGLAWAAGLRGLMSELAGVSSHVSWYGTFGQILLPGVLTGALLGYSVRSGDRRLIMAPLLFAVAVFVSPDAFKGLLFEGGIGGGAIALPLFGIAGGYLLAGRGPMWTRVLAGVVAVAPVPLWPLTNGPFGPDFAVTTAHGAWVALLLYSLIAVLEMACAIPLAGRRVSAAAGNQVR